MLDKKKQLLALVIAACLGTSAAQADELTGTLKKIKESGTVTLGYRDASLPFSYLNDAQQPIQAADYLAYLESVAKRFVFDRPL